MLFGLHCGDLAVCVLWILTSSFDALGFRICYLGLSLSDFRGVTDFGILVDFRDFWLIFGIFGWFLVFGFVF